MAQREGQAHPVRRQDAAPDGEQFPALPAQHTPSCAATKRLDTPCLWILPTATGGWWALPTDAAGLAAALRRGPPQLVGPQASGEQQARVAAAAQPGVMRAMARRVRRGFLTFFALAGLGCVLIAAAPAVAGFSGLLRLDALLLIGAGAACLCAALSAAMTAAKWHNWRVDACSAFEQARIVSSPLVERLACAIRLRHTLRAAERGKSPDDELLDAHAYRKLISGGVTTTAELCALSQSIAVALKLDAKDGDERKLADIARDAGLDMESALFYRDLAMAAAEISLAEDVEKITEAK